MTDEGLSDEVVAKFVLDLAALRKLVQFHDASIGALATRVGHLETGKAPPGVTLTRPVPLTRTLGNYCPEPTTQGERADDDK